MTWPFSSRSVDRHDVTALSRKPWERKSGRNGVLWLHIILSGPPPVLYKYPGTSCNQNHQNPRLVGFVEYGVSIDDNLLSTSTYLWYLPNPKTGRRSLMGNHDHDSIIWIIDEYITSLVYTFTIQCYDRWMIDDNYIYCSQSASNLNWQLRHKLTSFYHPAHRTMLLLQ